MDNALATIQRDTEFQKLIDLVANGKSANTRLAYERALRDFRDWFEEQPAEYKLDNGLSRASVLAYVDHLAREGLAPSTINQRLAALRALARELHYAQVGVFAEKRHADAITEIGNVPDRGVRTGLWLNTRQAKTLIATPDHETLKGKQQRVVIALLMGCALRREEAARVTVDMIQSRNNNWILANITGKGNRTRTVPIPPWAVSIIRDWELATGITKGRLLRAVNKADQLTGDDDGISPQAVYNIVKDLAEEAGLPSTLAPHDLRRTWGKKAYDQNAPLDQISLILGHQSIMTTEKYLGLKGLNLDAPVHVTY